METNACVSAPTGCFNGKDNQGYFALERDFGFGNYVAFAGKMDWRFKRKQAILRDADDRHWLS